MLGKRFDMKRIFGALIGLVVLVAVLLAAVFVFRLVRQGAVETRIRIESPGGIQEAGFVDINGEKQWVQIRGNDASKPIILFLAGGPGGTMIPLTHQSDLAWEKDFVMVHWDQPGAGKTLLENKGHEKPLTIDRMTADGVAVAAYISQKFQGRKIILLGHSWGSLLGVEMVRAKPNLFAAFVGTGQVIDLEANEAIGYQRLLERVTAAGKTKDVAKLQEIGPPPYGSQEELFAERKILTANPIPSERGLTTRLILTTALASGYTLQEAQAVGNPPPDATLVNELLTWKARDKGLDFSVPVIVIQGEDDIQTPTELVGPFVEELSAPYKKLDIVAGGGHMMVIAMSDVFLDHLKQALAGLPAT